MKLISKTTIMYRGRQYIAGEELPADNAEMVAAWKRADTVREVMEESEESQRRKAKRVVAEPGIPVTGANADELVGKVPGRQGRRKT